MNTSDKPLFHFRARVDRALTLSSLAFGAAAIVIMHVVLSITLWVSILGAFGAMALWVVLEDYLAFRRTVRDGQAHSIPSTNGVHHGTAQPTRRPRPGTPVTS